MGWYGGLGARLVYASRMQPGIVQPAATVDKTTRMVSCQWHNPILLAIPATWVSVIYMVKLFASNGDVRYASFVVRNDANHAPLIFQAAIMAYQAYNAFGGYSLYSGLEYPGTGNPTMTYADRAYVVSFDRPHTANVYAGLGPQARWELNFVPWLEKRGYNMSYLTDIDTDQNPSLLIGHKLIVFAGHDEYWSTAMRQNVTNARNAGVSLAFFVANDVYWHARLGTSPLGPGRLVICYRDTTLDPLAASTPSEATVRWRDAPLNNSEDSLLGERYLNETASNTVTPLVLGAGAQSLLAETGYSVGIQIPNVVGGEVDAVVAPVSVPALTTLAASQVSCLPSVICPTGAAITANTTIYTWTNGARVFDAGTFYWVTRLYDRYPSPLTFALTPRPGFERFTENILSYLL
ncbi:MAG TPA: N,N-dimethylformamidase beta subunit family domain-containing protein [Ktedonobacterales bacterium]